MLNHYSKAEPAKIYIFPLKRQFGPRYYLLVFGVNSAGSRVDIVRNLDCQRQTVSLNFESATIIVNFNKLPLDLVGGAVVRAACVVIIIFSVEMQSHDGRARTADVYLTHVYGKLNPSREIA